MLFTPGPVELTQNVLESQKKPMISHRSAGFREIFRECTDGMKKVFGTGGYVFTITGSGSTANEAAVANCAAGTKTLCLVNGEFGERLFEACKIYSPHAESMVLEDGKGFSLERVKEEIDSKKPELVAMVQNETALGVENKVRDIAVYAKKHGAHVLVDSVSALAGTEMRMDEWGVDFCTSASQKCLGCSPGLAFVALSEEAMSWVEKKQNLPTFCHDFKRYRKFYEKNETPFTPAVSVFYALQVALGELHADGLEKRLADHRKAAAKTRAAIEECGFSVFAEKGFESSTITGFLTDRCKEIKNAMAEEDVHIAGGAGHWKGRMLRISNMGRMESQNIGLCLDALRKACGKN
ncbi:alanine--glyoxylate aminotransferase family protein [Candidatus Micrarchaeota archaeon]|nr:alanine--glyoxylate aminotransferase family protein [Candidatus Micrarchaeota archaeon]